jgi:hypothetical protein
MIRKHLVCPERIRKIPAQFSWVDQRLVREGYIESLSHAAAALYLFLVTVGDNRGLSYYSDASIQRRLSMDGECLQSSRSDLIRTGLVAYKDPLYQVLALDCRQAKETVKRGGFPLSLGEILKGAKEEGA